MRAVLALSGGLDSSTLYGILRKEQDPSREVLPVMFTYGSKHNKYERHAAMQVAGYYGAAEVPVVNLEEPFAELVKSNLLKTGGAIPDGHYQEESMRATVVPGRNLVFIALMAAYAESAGADEVYLGVHAGDHFIYPDCRPAFIAAAKNAVLFSSDQKVTLRTPFLKWDKALILKRGLEVAVPYALTRTCYKDQAVACGVCGSCQERLEAFELNGVPDPIGYQSRDLIAKS